MFTMNIDRSQTKGVIKAHLLDMSRANGGNLSKSAADKWANKIKQGKFNTDMVREFAKVIGYSDPTGERATNNVMRELALA
ncbi:hypothetical protein ACIP5Z_01495 [Rothia terrae]|uniref:hypothetical protein n=1 Tax=Rothia terrae TaxID=396015 RepID=UPI0037FC3817